MSRPAALIALLVGLGPALGGCGYTPQQLGITGPGTSQTAVSSHASDADEDAVIGMPGLQTGGSGDPGNSVSPTYGNDGRFFGYN